MGRNSIGYTDRYHMWLKEVYDITEKNKTSVAVVREALNLIVNGQVQGLLSWAEFQDFLKDLNESDEENV